MDWRKNNKDDVKCVHGMNQHIRKTRNGKVVKRTTWNSRRVDQRFGIRQTELSSSFNLFM